MKLNKTESSEEQTNSREMTDGEDSTHEVKDTAQKELERNRIRFISNLLVDNKQSFMDDVNYSREFPEFKDKTAGGKTLNPEIINSPFLNLHYHERDVNRYTKGNGKRRIKIPRSTIIKADRVRIYLDNYYSRLEGSISMENPNHLHEGVEGVYNPLQVIRNRVLKKKYNEMPIKPLSMQKPPLIAILAFSRKPRKKMPWFVDVSEASSDLTWRTSHWDELVDPQGNLWFGTKGSLEVEGLSSKYKHPHHGHSHHGHHHYLGLHRSSGSSVHEDIELQNYNVGVDDNESSGTSADHTVDPKELDIGNSNQIEYGHQKCPSTDSERSGSNKFEAMMKIPRGSKSPNSRHKILASPMEKRTTRSHHGRTGSTETRSRHDCGSVSSNIPNVSLSNISTAGRGGDSQLLRNNLLNALSLHRLRSSEPGAVVDDEEKEYTERPVKSSPHKYEYEHVNRQLQKYRSETTFLLNTLKVINHRKMTDDILKKRYIQKRRNFLNDRNAISTASNALDKLKAYEKELDRSLEKGNNYTSSLLNDCSVRVETLMSIADRILSDINTTLTLKLKVLQENADRFGTLRMMQSQRLTKVLYSALEFTIIIICWTIWFAVSILKCMKLTMILTIKLLKWVIW